MSFQNSKNVHINDLLERVKELESTLAAESGDPSGALPGWSLVDTGNMLWTRWAGPTAAVGPDEEDTDFPLLRVRREDYRVWKWEVWGVGYKRLAFGYAETAREGMRKAEASNATKEWEKR